MKNLTRALLMVSMGLTVTGNVLAFPLAFTDASDSSVSLSNVKRGWTVPVSELTFGAFNDRTIGGGSTIAATINDDLVNESFTLNDGQYKTVELFDLKRNGDGWGKYDIDANLAFATPSIDVGVSGDGSWGNVDWDWSLNLGVFGTVDISGNVSGGLLQWDDSSLGTLFVPDEWILDYNTSRIGEWTNDFFPLIDTTNVDSYRNFSLIGGDLVGVFFQDGIDLSLSETEKVHAFVVNFGGGADAEEPNSVPEPAPLLLFFAGLFALGLQRRMCRSHRV